MAPTKADFWPRFIHKHSGLFELIRTDISQRRMETRSVVKSFDVIGGSANGLVMRFVNGVIDLFHLEAFEEAFHWRVVVAVPFSAHALQETLVCEAFSKRLAGVLGSPVAVYDQSFLWLSEGDRLVECGQREAGIDVLAGGPADDFA